MREEEKWKWFGSEVSAEFPALKENGRFLARDGKCSSQGEVTNWATILTDFHLLVPIFLSLEDMLTTHMLLEGCYQSIILTHFWCHNEGKKYWVQYVVLCFQIVFGFRFPQSWSTNWIAQLLQWLEASTTTTD